MVAATQSLNLHRDSSHPVSLLLQLTLKDNLRGMSCIHAVEFIRNIYHDLHRHHTLMHPGNHTVDAEELYAVNDEAHSR